MLATRTNWFFFGHSISKIDMVFIYICMYKKESISFHARSQSEKENNSKKRGEKERKLTLLLYYFLHIHTTVRWKKNRIIPLSVSS